MANCLVVNLLKYGMSHCDNRDADTSMQYTFYHEFLILLNLLLRKKKINYFSATLHPLQLTSCN